MHTVQAADNSLLFECTMLHSGSQVDIVWAHGEKAPALPEFLVLRLEGYTGPVWSSDPRYEGCIPIAPFETSWSATGDDRGHETRQ